MTNERSVIKESGVHGSRWETLHDGYFSSPETALPLTGAIESAISIARPLVIADLGGGTGFILRELLYKYDLSGIRLVNVDLSQRQLSACSDDRIEAILASADKITRGQLIGDEGALILVARSILHYFGRSGLRQVLRHIRHQLKDGEFFVHQSACFQNRDDARCLNLIYELMGSDKWYGTTDDMAEALREEGFEICSVARAPAIHLSSDDLSERYGLDEAAISSIRAAAQEMYGSKPEVFASSGGGFDAWLHLYIFTCRAV